MRDKTPWHEDEDFWTSYQSNMFDEDSIAAAEKEVEAILELVEVETPAEVLDLCCGVGRHSIELAKRGFDVTGVDITKPYLESAIKKAEEENVEVEFVHGDMRKYKKDSEYDLVVNLFTSFGFFRDPVENLQVIKNVHTSLKQGGTFVIDVMGKEIIARIFRKRDWYEKNGVYYLEERSVTDDWSRMTNRWLTIEKGEVSDFTIDHRLYSAHELKDMLEKTGFSDTTVYGDFKGSPYDEHAKRLVTVSTK